MAIIHLYAYVEDKPTKAALRRIIEYVNTDQENKFCFAEGFPAEKMVGFSFKNLHDNLFQPPKMEFGDCL